MKKNKKILYVQLAVLVSLISTTVKAGLTIINGVAIAITVTSLALNTYEFYMGDSNE